MSERVEFIVVRAGYRDDAKWFVSTELFKKESEAEAILASLNDREEELKRFKAENSMLRTLASKLDAKAEAADRYERWLTDIGREIGCGHIDERLPGCVASELERLKAENAAQAAEIEKLKEACRQARRELLCIIRQSEQRGGTAGGPKRVVEIIDAAIADKEPEL